jgi:hypothetical protein
MNPCGQSPYNLPILLALMRRAAFEKMRAACRQAGFDGLYLLGEYRGLDPNHLRLMKSLGLDCTFA